MKTDNGTQGGGPAERWSAHAMEGLVNAVVKVLAEVGARPGDAVAFGASPAPQNIAAAIAAQRLGLRAVPVDATFALEEAAFVLNDSGARFVLLSLRHGDLEEQLSPLTPYVEAWRVLDEDALGSSVGSVVERAAPSRGSLHYTAVVTGRPSGFVAPDPFDDPRGRRDVAGLLGHRHIGPEDSLLVGTALCDPAALQLVLAVHDAGGAIITTDHATPAEVAGVVADSCPSLVHLSPGLALGLAKQTPFSVGEGNGPELVLVTVPGCAPFAIHALVEAWGPVVRQVYVAPGVGVATAIDGVEVLLYPDAMGRPLEGTDALGIRVAGMPDVGEIEVEDPAGSGHWIATGDQGCLDHGRLIVVDHLHGSGDERALEMPRAIETLLAAHPLVADAAVIVHRGDSADPQVMGFVQPTVPRDHAALEAELLELVRSRLPARWTPGRIGIAPRLPRTASGKLDRRRLVALDPMDMAPPA